MKVIHLILFILTVSCLNAQEESGKNLISVDLDYFYHYMGENTKNDFNYGGSIMFGKQYPGVEFRAGLNFSTKKYHYQTNPDVFNNYLAGRHHHIYYINVPIVSIIGHLKDEDVGLRGLVGIVTNIPIKYSITSTYSDGSEVKANYSELSKQIGMSFRVGMCLHKYISDNTYLEVSLYSDIKFLRSEQWIEGNIYLPDNLLSFGIQLSLTHLF